MSNYTKSTNFATKDTLTSGDPLKIVKGTEINTEFDNIATAVNSKANTASPTFTGTVTIPSLSLSGLTASSAVATDGSSALVSVTNTGSGNNVLATSPTLVTPALGTPSSGVLTNCTGVQYNGFKNRIINGQMQIAQRATSATITAGSTIAAGYSTVDRFYVYCTGANVTAAQVAGSGANKNNLQITGAASVTAVGIGQRIEQLNSYDMAGSTATLSVNLANSLLTTVTWTAYYATTADTFGTLASPTRTQISTGTFTVTSTLTNYSAQISIPAAATTGIEVVFIVGAQTSGTWVIGNVQLEKSSIATSYDYRSYPTEFAMCQRYYQTSYPYGVALQGLTNITDGASFICFNTSDTSNGGPIPVTMRATPVFATYSSNGGVGANSARNGAGTDVTGITLNGGTTNNLPRLTKASIGTTGAPLTAHWTAVAEL
jgi:hypothetical protein